MWCSMAWVRGFVIVIAAAVVPLPGFGAAVEPAGPKPRLSFNRDIRPILSDNCFACHGPDSGNRQAGLRLDMPDVAMEELDSGARAIVPEKIDESELVARIVSDDPDAVMPPPHAKIGRLLDEQVETLERWIAEGATYEPHWAFVSPMNPKLAAVSAGAGAIDTVVRGRLATRGPTLQPEADRRTLIRRASFDITGLPPTPGQVEAFVADASPDAYEKLLDRLLASPRYGERLDGSGPLFRQLWFPGRSAAARHVAVARLGGQVVQRQPAVGQVHALAGGRRPPAARHRRAGAGHGLQPTPPAGE